MTDDCLFCKIVDGQIPADVVAESEHSIAFRDINPQAPTHVLVIPRQHVVDAPALAQVDPVAAADLLALARTVATNEGLADFRLVFNNGAGAQQTVFHAHGHVIGGRDVGWPPG